MRLILFILFLVISSAVLVHFQIKLSKKNSWLYLLLPIIVSVICTIYTFDRFLLYGGTTTRDNILQISFAVLCANIPALILLLIGRHAGRR